MYNKIERAVIEINGICNYKCTYCPKTESRGQFATFIPLTEYKRLLLQCVDIGIKVIQLEGSGEATLLPNLHEYIKATTDSNIFSHIYTNGYCLTKDNIKKYIESGLTYCRVSINGYNRENYKKNTGVDAFDRVLENCLYMKEYIEKYQLDTKLSLYHLILDKNISEEEEVNLYRKNIIEKLNLPAEIWKTHNWGGFYENSNRKGLKKTCGRPFANEITIRAGGLDGRTLSMVPCCQTMGNDENSILGYCDMNSILEVFNSKEYNNLRNQHLLSQFDQIASCKNCDFLYDDPTVLVWKNTNSYGNINQMNNTNIILKRN